MKIDHREIGITHPPYIIAEISANHGGSAREGKELIQAAVDCGADCVKIQCYTADSLTFRGEGEDFVVKGGLWQGQTLHELYKKAETPPKLVRELFSFSKKQKITIFSSVFDFEGVDLMVELGAPAIKIASFELVDLPLIKKSVLTGLPMIISTGMGSREEIISCLNSFYRLSVNEQGLGLLHCVSSYPASPKEANLPALGPLASLLGNLDVVGYSDHTLGFGTACGAVAFGASIIEKHFILDRGRGGPDSAFSLEPSEFVLLVKACRESWEAIQPSSPKLVNLNYRKSLFLVRDVCAGDNFSSESVRIIRPASGLAPKFYEAVLAGAATRDLKAGTPLSREMVSTLC